MALCLRRGRRRKRWDVYEKNKKLKIEKEKLKIEKEKLKKKMLMRGALYFLRRRTSDGNLKNKFQKIFKKEKNKAK